MEKIFKIRNVSKEEFKDFYSSRGYSVDIETNLSIDEIKKYHYRLMYDILKERGIKLVIMQYPTLDVDELKDMFDGGEDIIFISNEENFKKALSMGEYEDYFFDNIRPTFGHATPKGNRLIAENVANVLEENDYIK